MKNAAILILALSAACGSNGNATYECGDGIVNGNEQCDDGNTTSGDGCSSACKLEGKNTCGDGTVDVATETCDDGNTVDGDGCSAHCQIENNAVCGNGKVETGETCDDGNTANADGCSSTCHVESGYTCTGTPSVCTMGGNVNGGTCAQPAAIALTNGNGTATGDTTNTTNQMPAEHCDGYASGGGNEQIFKFTTTAVADVTVTLTAPDFDSTLRLMTTACDRKTQVSDLVSHDGCAELGALGDGEELSFQKLPAGTYFVLVGGFSAQDFGTFTLDIASAAPTGTCGDGELDSNEECDTGGTANARCSSECTLVSDTTEVEPNDDAAHAQVITPVNHIIRGSISSGTDYDLYKFTLTAPGHVNIETYDAMDPMSDYLGVGEHLDFDCLYAQNQISIFDSNGDPTDDTTALMSDAFDGDYDDVNFASQCAYIGTNNANATGDLPAGTYILKIEDDFFDIGLLDFFPDYENHYILDVDFGVPNVTMAPGAGDLAINEVMLADNMSDTNCDGSTTDTVDEFVELVNVTTHPLDLTGVTISDAMQVRHTFAPGTSGSMTLAPGKAMVVWGGGAPACAGVTNWFVASTGSLGLTDGGDTVTIKNAAAVTVATATFGNSTLNKSWNLNPDITGTAYVLHDAVTGHAGAYSPGKKNDGTAF